MNQVLYNLSTLLIMHKIDPANLESEPGETGINL